MERPLAHLLPEMTANLLAPVCILVYLFILDWRMALLSLVSIPVGMAFMMAVTALSLPSIIMLKKTVKPKLLTLFIVICTLGIIAVGYLFNLFHGFLI